MAEVLQVPYASVALAALVPGLLYYAALFIQADLESAKLGMRGLSAAEIPSARSVLTGWPFVASFAVLIVALFRYNWQPERAALVAAATAALLSYVTGYQGRRPNLGELARSVVRSGYGAVDIILIGAGAGIVIGVLNVTGLSFNLTYLLVQVGASSAVLLLVLSAIVCIILGMGLPTLGVYVLLAALVAPSLIEAGVAKLSAHMFILYFGMMSMITPPIALAAFAAASISRGDPMKTGYVAMRMGWVAYVIPFVFVLSPTLLMVGAPWKIALNVTSATIGVYVASVAMVGYFTRPLGVVARLLLGIGGLAAVFPDTVIGASGAVDAVGIALSAAILGREYLTGGRPTATPAGAAPS
jgi:TRAP transporter 4TM/12TM fusion protein